ncbi:MAG: hypothetical protein HGA53_00930 [Anaerolineaceae bacterium]|nr:hypothetical protein [Anaerolineaceae bacterium]
MRKTSLLFIVLIAAVALSACGQQNIPTLLPTVDPMIIEQTVNAVLTQKAVEEGSAMTQQALATSTPLPTYTLMPSSTPMPTYTPYPTWTSIPPTATGKPVTVTPAVIGTQATAKPADYACSIVSYSPAEAKIFKPFQNFDGVFRVKNTGTKAWKASNMDVIWLEETNMAAKSKSYDLSEDTATGKSVDIVVDLKAPGYNGYFWTTWALKTGSTTFCRMTLYIGVRK